MKKKLILLFLFLGLLLVPSVTASGFKTTATGMNRDWAIFNNWIPLMESWVSSALMSFMPDSQGVQTFKTHQAYTVRSVAFRFFSCLSTGTITINVKAVDGSHKPTGSSLSTGTMPVNTITTNYAWYIINMSSYLLSNNTEYALTLDCSAGNEDEWVAVMTAPDFIDGIYTEGYHWSWVPSIPLWFNYTADNAVFFAVFGNETTSSGGSTNVILSVNGRSYTWYFPVGAFGGLGVGMVLWRRRRKGRNI